MSSSRSGEHRRNYAQGRNYESSRSRSDQRDRDYREYRRNYRDERSSRRYEDSQRRDYSPVRRRDRYERHRESVREESPRRPVEHERNWQPELKHGRERFRERDYEGRRDRKERRDGVSPFSPEGEGLERKREHEKLQAPSPKEEEERPVDQGDKMDGVKEDKDGSLEVGKSHDAMTRTKSAEEEIVEQEDEATVEMKRIMGFSGFDTTTGKKHGDVGQVYKQKKTKYRQYMNRPGGFNRPLDNE